MRTLHYHSLNKVTCTGTNNATKPCVSFPQTLKSDYDQAMNHFEQCQVLTRLMHNLHFLCTCLYLHSQSLVIFFSQDAYATELFAFLSQEKEFAEKIHKVWSHCLYQYK